MDGKKIALKSTPKQYSRHDIWELGFRTAHGKVTSRGQPTVNSIVCLISQQIKELSLGLFSTYNAQRRKKQNYKHTCREINNKTTAISCYFMGQRY